MIIPLLGLKDLALARPVCTFFDAYWQDKFCNNVLPLRVGNDVATIDDVMGVIEILSSRLNGERKETSSTGSTSSIDRAALEKEIEERVRKEMKQERTTRSNLKQCSDSEEELIDEYREVATTGYGSFQFILN